LTKRINYVIDHLDNLMNNPDDRRQYDNLNFIFQSYITIRDDIASAKDNATLDYIDTEISEYFAK